MDRLTALKVLLNLSRASCTLAGAKPGAADIYGRRPEEQPKGKAKGRPPRYEWIATGPGPNDGWWEPY